MIIKRKTIFRGETCWIRVRVVKKMNCMTCSHECCWILILKEIRNGLIMAIEFQDKCLRAKIGDGFYVLARPGDIHNLKAL